MVKKGVKLTVIMLLLFMWSSLLLGAYQIKEVLPVKIPDIPGIKVNISDIPLPDETWSEVNITQVLKFEQLMQQELEKSKVVVLPAIEMGDEIYSKYALLLDLKTNNVISQKSAQQRFYPASLTKIMTVILAIEKIPDLEQEVILPGAEIERLNGCGASMAGFLPNERVKAVDLLYGAALPSGADATLGLSILAGGSEQDFVVMMNNKAKELGMGNTHFINSSGLHDSEQYTTAEDLAKLLKYALNNKVFKEIFTTANYRTSSTLYHPGGLNFSNFILKYISSTGADNGTVLGGKTGYTKEAGLCLATLAQKGDKQYILITAAAQGDLKNIQYNIVDAVNIYNKYMM